MAHVGGLLAIIGSLPADSKRVMTELINAAFPNLRGGPIEHQRKLENFQRYYVNSTTNSTANDEFTVVHGMGRAPFACRQVLPLDQIGSKEVRLEVTRAADSVRVYLRSPEASAPITLELE